MILKDVNCYNCKSSRSTFYDSENEFTLVKCLDCGLLYVNPRPDEDEIDEASKTGRHQGEKYLDVTGRFKERKVKIYLDILNDFYYEDINNAKKYKWIDIGAGHGEFLKALQIFFGETFDVMGIEPNIYKQRSAQKHGLNVTFLDIDNHNGKYDCLSLLNVYSHLPNPVENLKKWANLLNRDGEILLQTGDTSYLSFRDHYKPYYLPNHLSFASEAIVKNVLEKIGFRVVQIQKYRFPALPKFTPIGIMKEIIKFVLPNKRSSFNFFQKYPNTDMWIRAKRVF